MIAEAEAVLTNLARVVNGKPPDNLVPELQPCA
jgi:hypothetical protein